MNIDRCTILGLVSGLIFVTYLISIFENSQKLAVITTIALLLLIVEILFNISSIIKRMIKSLIRFWRTITPQGNSNNIHQAPLFVHTIQFFEKATNLITIIGAIVTIISLSPLFLTLILGDDWFHILLTNSLGIQTLFAVVSATIFAAFFIYCILALILVRWINQIFLNNKVESGEKLFSFIILLSGIIATFCLVWFLLSVWFSRGNVPILLIGLNIFIFITALAIVIVISGLLSITRSIPSIPARAIFYVIIIVLFGMVVLTIVYPAIISFMSLYQTTNNYSDDENFSFSFTSSILSDKKTILLRPDYSNYPNSSVNIEYMDCHWSTNYGYFLTITNGTRFIEKRSSNFVIPKCIQNGTQGNDEQVYWTYDISDYSKNKPSVIISFQVENSNKKSFDEKLGESKDYVVGGNYSNFAWGEDIDNITKSNSSFF